MPNLNAPSGLAPILYRDGSPYNGMPRLYAIAPANVNAFFVGDVVKIDATNFADPTGIPCVTIATAGAAARGVVVAIGLATPQQSYQGGPFINPNDLTKTSRPTGAQALYYYAAVVDDPQVIFEVQEDVSAAPGAAAQITKNANLSFAAPATGVALSGQQLLASSYAVTATLNLKVLQAVQRPDNTPYTANQKLLVLLNNHDFSSGSLGY